MSKAIAANERTKRNRQTLCDLFGVARAEELLGRHCVVTHHHDGSTIRGVITVVKEYSIYYRCRIPGKAGMSITLTSLDTAQSTIVPDDMGAP